jgi:hypothetical protein
MISWTRPKIRGTRWNPGPGKEWEKVEAARGPHTEAVGAQAPRRGQREPRGAPEETLLSKGIQKTPEDPKMQDKTLGRRLILNCTYQKTSRL